MPVTRLKDMEKYLAAAIELGGDIAECGVFRGGSAYYIANFLASNGFTGEFHLFDTFSGMPETDEKKDIHKKGDFADTNFELVSNLMSKFPFVKIHKGLFSNTLRNVSEKRFSFVNVDCDIYSGVKECSEFFYERLVDGGVIVYDDYCSPSCPGAKSAVDEFAVGKDLLIPELPPTGDFDYAVLKKNVENKDG